jgi:hypothetical protein
MRPMICRVCVLFAVLLVAFGNAQVTAQTVAEADYWLVNASRDHGFSIEEAAAAAGVSVAAAQQRLGSGELPATAAPVIEGQEKILPYPGGRHPRIGFLDGAIDPMRGTKVSVFAPWDEAAYVVVDVPEAIFSNLGLVFLAHTHVPTIWDESNTKLPDVQWEREASGRLRQERRLPNGIVFGTEVTPIANGAAMRMWLTNGTDAPLSSLRTQVCVMLKGLPGFTALNEEGKTFESPVAIARAQDGSGHALLTAWSHTGRAWGNPDVPCIHADPIFPDAAPGATVEVLGEIVFSEKDSVDVISTDMAQRFKP